MKSILCLIIFFSFAASAQLDATVTGSTTACQNDTMPQFIFTGTGGTAPYTFYYNINGGSTQSIVSTGNSAALNIPTDFVGTFDYSLIYVEDSNSSTQQLANSPATLNVNPLPTATISGSITVCVGSSPPTITFTGANAIAPYTFSYTLNGGAIQTLTSNGSTGFLNISTSVADTFICDLVYVDDSSLTVCGQNQSGQVIVIVEPCADIEETAINYVVLFPNPVQHEINLKSETNFNSYRIYHFSGLIVEEGKLLSKGKIDVQNLEKGSYFIELIGSDFSIVKQFLKN